MSKKDSTKKRHKKEKFIIENQEFKEPPTWDQLFDMYNESKNFISGMTLQLIELTDTFKNEIDADKELSEIVNGVSLTIKEFAIQLNTIARTHSRKDGDTFYFYTGKISPTDTTGLSHYLNVCFSYSGLLENTKVFSNATLVAMLTNIREKIEQQKEEASE